MKQLSRKVIEDIIANKRKNLSNSIIANKLNVSKYSVYKYTKDIVNIQNKGLAGRPKKLSEREIRICSRMITIGNAKTSVDVQKELKETYNVDVCNKTVRTALNEQGLYAAEKLKKPLLN